MCVGYSSLTRGTLICLLSVGNSFKTCIISVGFGKALEMSFPAQQIHSNFKHSFQIKRGHIKVPKNKF